jgi:hypothetical protein
MHAPFIKLWTVAVDQAAAAHAHSFPASHPPELLVLRLSLESAVLHHAAPPSSSSPSFRLNTSLLSVTRACTASSRLAMVLTDSRRLMRASLWCSASSSLMWLASSQEGPDGSDILWGGWVGWSE